MKKILLLIISLLLITGCTKEKVICTLALSDKAKEEGLDCEEVIGYINGDNLLTDVELVINFKDKNALDEYCGLFEMSNEYATENDKIDFKCGDDSITFTSARSSLNNLKISEDSVMNKDKETFINAVTSKGFTCN